MSVISGIIAQQSFELIHDRIGEILVDELANQFALSGNADLDVTVYKERHIPFGIQELPSVNVLMERGEYNNQSQPNTQGTYRYLIECTHSSPSKDTDSNNTRRGDTLAMSKLQRLIGVIRAILEDPKYKTLGFTAPFLGNRHAENMYFMKHPHQDADNIVQGRLTFVVSAPESSVLIYPNLIQGYDTTVKLHETEKGYIWTLDEP